MWKIFTFINEGFPENQMKSVQLSLKLFGFVIVVEEIKIAITDYKVATVKMHFHSYYFDIVALMYSIAPRVLIFTTVL